MSAPRKKGKGPEKLNVADITTCRRHIEAYHLVCFPTSYMCDNYSLLTLYSIFKGTYNNWCTQNNFESKLPKTVKARTAAANKDKKQSQLDPHLQERVPKTRVVPYSDELFRQAAIEWLVATDQVRVS